ncbi:Adiponectin receptor protein 2 [Rhizoclosmatium hyalinum]|nr:Adiponectin receptor protein 2 [Rhizoclosmatium hyalinum]
MTHTRPPHPSERLLTDFPDQVPRYMQDNEDIHGHYRAFYSYKENWISLFHLHNESVNVWNHLIGGFISIVLGLCSLYGITIRTLNLADPMDRIMILLHCLASAFTFFTSGLYHLHLSHSYEAYNWWGCWDYAGISAQIGGATVALLYYLFYCETGLRTMWATLVLCFSSVGVIGPYFSFWPTAKFRPIRSAIYVASAVVSGGPVFHFLWLHGWSALPKNGAVELMGLSLSCYLIGVVFYVSRFPESVWPGKFDLWFASHQIWHSLVVAAVFFHFHVVFGLIEWRHERGVCESQS